MKYTTNMIGKYLKLSGKNPEAKVKYSGFQSFGDSQCYSANFETANS